jgi:hypothetical protein
MQYAIPLLLLGQLVTPAKEAVYRAALPPVADPALEAVLADPRLLFYDEAVMPRAYQFSGGSFVAVRDNVGTDGNFRFPWRKPAGMQRVRGVATFKALYLPPKHAGTDERWPVVCMPGRLDVARDRQNSLVWLNPVGAIYLEVGLMQGPDKKQYVFVLRLREREIDDWNPEAVVPFKTAAQVAEGIKMLREGWEADPQLVALVNTLEAPRVLRGVVFPDPNAPTDTDRPPFRVSAGQYFMPRMEYELTRDLLVNAVFEPAAGVPFFVGEAPPNGTRARADAPSCSPGTGFNIVPENYDGTFMGNDRVRCMGCHNTVGAQQVRFDNSWNAHVAGSDGIISFSPIRPERIGGAPVIVRGPDGRDRVDTNALHPSLLAAGIIAVYNPTEHPNTVYAGIEKLRHPQ